MLLRPQTLIAGFGKPMARNQIGAKAVQIYAPGRMSWSKKSLIVRNAPYTIEDPTLAQIETRLTFADVAKDAAGCSGLVDGLPCVAAAIRRTMKDYRAADTKPKEEWESRQKPSFHTVEDLKKMLEEKARKKRRELPARF